MSMFCFQCQETVGNKGCTRRGVCGKPDEVANLQDLLIYLLKGISVYGVKARELGVADEEANVFVMQSLFSTITNVNFDVEWFVERIERALTVRDRMRDKFLVAYKEKHGAKFASDLPEMATWYSPNGKDALLEKGESVGVMEKANLDEDIRSLRELLTYGLKGMAAYADHAHVLGYEDPEIYAFLQEGLAATTDDSLAVDDLVGLVLKCGQMGVKTMALLDKANTETYGHPEPTQVNIGAGDKPGILISGHDLRDLDELLQQTVGKDVDVYTHGEMLPTNAYPAFKKYDHFVGNYGGSWWKQQAEFEKFNGAILMTTNCIQKPRDSYKDRIFTTGLVGWPEVTHIPDREPGKQKDFSPVIEKALQCDSPEELESGTIPIGFAHNAVLGVADKVIDAVKGGAIKRFVVMAGCDGRLKSREYFTDFAKSLPQDTVILTAGCAKYRYNKLDLGDIGGIPRVLDAGQCNDSYSLVVIAQKLAEAFGLEDINELPVSYDIGWYEQKAVLVLLALLSLGVKHIHLGPTLPAFLSPNVIDVLVKNFDIKPTSTVEEDMEMIMSGN